MAQKNFKTLPAQYVSVTDPHLGQKHLMIHFKNINRVDYYFDLKKLQQIKVFEEKKDFKRAILIMEEYVSNFGVRNFAKDIYMLWRIGIFYEKEGNHAKAEAYIRLVLKHTRQNLERVKLYHDSISKLDKDYWVPLKYYYELVEFRKSIDSIVPPQSVLTSLGTEVNSKYEDYGPALNPATTMLLFTSKRNKTLITEQSNEDIFFCTGEDNFWDKAQPFGSINTQWNEGSPCISKDGKTLFFARCNSPMGYGNCDIFSAVKVGSDSTWSQVKNLGSHVNSRGWDSQPALSHTEDTLYYASDKIGGFGLSDIYMTVKQKDGSWGPSQNLGPYINTRDNDVSPYYHSKYHVLYFSSNGQLMNFCEIDSNNQRVNPPQISYDIYKSRLVSGLWDDPKNIGPLVNGAGSEYYFTIDAQSKNIYYARSEKENIKNLDIYSFPLPMEGQPLAYTKLEGNLVDSVTKQPLKGVISIIDLDKGIEVAPKFLRPDGTFEFDLINNNRYLVIIQGDDFFKVEEELFLKNDTVINLVSKIIDMQRPLVLDRIEFEHGKWDILPEMTNSLNLVLKYLIDNPSCKLKISGHTDAQGNPDDNLKLSKNRASAIRDYLIKKGNIDAKRITSEGYGNTKPLRAEENTPEDKKINRRVEFDIIK